MGIDWRKEDKEAGRAFSFAADLVGDVDAKKAWYRSFWGAQATAYERGGGWIFWSWKCDHIDETKDLTWCYRNAVEKGIIPKDASTAAGFSGCGGS